jgi:hypothetical protein
VIKKSKDEPVKVLLKIEVEDEELMFIFTAGSESVESISSDLKILLSEKLIRTGIVEFVIFIRE